jgi:Na+-transporting methylmalonyl-CoA/oxaloacetate decarboxylase gamma subunit
MARSHRGVGFPAEHGAGGRAAVRAAPAVRGLSIARFCVGPVYLGIRRNHGGEDKVGSDFGIAVEVTIVGMILVFATLIICALVISGLARLFRPRREAAAMSVVEGEPLLQGQALDILPNVGATEVAPPLTADEAVAVAVAIALASRKSTRARPEVGGERATMPVVRRPLFDVDDEDVVGEVITVTNIDPGQDTWSGYGRIRAAR